MPITGVKAEMARLEEELENFEKEGVAEVRKASFILLRNLHARTPVWTGEAVANYTAGIGSINRSRRGGLPPPASQGPNTPLGAEVNRAASEQKAVAGLNATMAGLQDLSRNVIFSNTVESGKWDLLDNGSAPTKERARNPGGITKLAIQTTRAQLENWK